MNDTNRRIKSLFPVCIVFCVRGAFFVRTQVEGSKENLRGSYMLRQILQRHVLQNCTM
jgi:hypothetical protein